MPDTALVRPKGLFDRSTLGFSMPAVTVTVERGQVVFFSQVVGETRPVHLDFEAARAEGFPDVVAPPTFFTAIEAMVEDETRRQGRVPILARVGCDFRYLLHGDERYDYRGLVFAGDEVTVTTRVVDFYDKKGGTMEFVTLESTLDHAERGRLLTTTRTLLHRLA